MNELIDEANAKSKAATDVSETEICLCVVHNASVTTVAFL